MLCFIEIKKYQRYYNLEYYSISGEFEIPGLHNYPVCQHFHLAKERSCQYLSQNFILRYLSKNMDQKVGSVNDWIAQYDRDGDGELDVSELQELQTRLSKQMTDNIQLTKHLNALETRSANHAAEVKEKEATLRKALEAMDYSRTVQNELRSKLSLFEQNATIMGADVSLFISIIILNYCTFFLFFRFPPFTCTTT